MDTHKESKKVIFLHVEDSMKVLKVKLVNPKSTHACEYDMTTSDNSDLSSSRSGQMLQGCLRWVLAPTPPEGRYRFYNLMANEKHLQTRLETVRLAVRCLLGYGYRGTFLKEKRRKNAMSILRDALLG